ncbi:VCBS repeat-containing protein [Lacibacter sp. H375]|uniref:VCBS repeat-containing protein n=1 Tax=Lacibacter sp. H375 TaxID=3133424 RepID=UPI0030BED2DD
MNIIDQENIYNGGGIGIADFNNDGLQDIYFTGNMISNKLYLNKGKMQFDDITTIAKVEGEGKWSRGVSIIDINDDGLQDIYISCTMLSDSLKRENILYVNQGNSNKGLPVFKNLAREYGLADNSYTTQSAFFDYDNDGDLDVYMTVNMFAKRDNGNAYRPILKNGEHPNTDKLYRNDWDSAKHHPVFVDVSRKAGVLQEGYGHSVTICDLNLDGWKDVFVANDYLSENILYINNRNGTFTNHSSEYFKHTAYNAMGADVVDINNDGLSDVIELDMNPEDNYRKKMMLNSGNYQSYINNTYYGFQYQYVRNMLHVNMGLVNDGGDSTKRPVFAETGFYSGIAETDWSWAPLVADFDNDGLRDIIITNGFPRDVTDHDFMVYRNSTFALNDRKKLLAMIPQVKIENYAYRNTGNIRFENVGLKWGFNEPSFSNGAATADLDIDGDLDVVINNINDKAFLYENKLNNSENKLKHFLAVKLKSPAPNRNAYGAWVTIYYGINKQVYEVNPVRGYLSSNELMAWFGLDSINHVDSVEVIWPDNTKQVQYNVVANKTLVIDKSQNREVFNWKRPDESAMFTEVSNQLQVNYQHQPKDFNDYNIQKLLPHKLSEIGPVIATGDINGDELEDFVVSGNNNIRLFFQQESGQFKTDSLLIEHTSTDADLLLFDADNDADLDLYVCRGGYEQPSGSSYYTDALFLNNGQGKFLASIDSLPSVPISKSCVRAADFDKDGDIDLFLGGRVEPGNYPKAVSSIILRNDTRQGRVKYTDITASVAPVLQKVGLVCDAVWNDFNKDGEVDLVVVGEWMPITFFANKGGKFVDVTKSTGLNNQSGWWNCIKAADLDKDGDVDFVAGNTGLNSFFTFNENSPVNNYYNDFDKNGRFEFVTTKYLKNKKGILQEFIANGRDDVMDQIPALKKRYLSYSSFADAALKDIFLAEQWKGVEQHTASYFKTVVIRNNGNGVFRFEELPWQAQLSAVKDICIDDFDKDGIKDIVLTGNDFSFEVVHGRLDAFNGLFLQGLLTGGYRSLSLNESGLYIPMAGAKLRQLKTASGLSLLIASQYNGDLKVFKKN